MRVIPMEFDRHIEGSYPLKQKIRDLGDSTIWYAGDGMTLILVDPFHCCTALFVYDSFEDVNKDIEIVMNIDRDGGDASSGAPAWLKPAPPTRAAGFAQPVPTRGDTE
jgi:hypothetical protein